MTSPREILTNRALDFMSPKRLALNRPSVSEELGKWQHTMSLCSSNFSNWIMCTFAWETNTESTATYGSYATTCIPNALARMAVRNPIRPKPTTPIVLPCNSIPVHALRSQPPDLVSRSAAGMRRASANTSPIVSSATETAFWCGVDATTTPAATAADTSMLSRPTPARPITLSRGDCAIRSAVTGV